MQLFTQLPKSIDLILQTREGFVRVAFLFHRYETEIERDGEVKIFVKDDKKRQEGKLLDYDNISSSNGLRWVNP